MRTRRGGDKGKRMLRVGLTLCAVALLTWGVLRLVRPPHSITDRAQLVTSGRNSSIGGFVWLNDHEALYCEGSNPTPVRWNTLTQTQSAFPVPKSITPPLMAAMSQTTSRPWLVSPDGKRLLWRYMGSQKGVVQNLTGDTITQFALTSNPFDRLLANWLPTSNSVVQIEYLGANGAATLTTHQFAPVVGRSTQRHNTPPQIQPYTLELIGNGSDGSTLALARIEPTEKMQFAVFNASLPQGAQTPTHLISFPIDWDIIAWSLSPQGDRIVWTRRESHTGRLPSWLPYWIRDHSRPDEHEVWFYTTRTDGSALREIGHEVGASMASFINAPQWMPGGKAISFTRGGNLYTLPVP